MVVCYQDPRYNLDDIKNKNLKKRTNLKEHV